MNRIIRCFFETDMRMSHPGLTDIARKHKVDIDQVGDGEHLIFINSAQNKMKMLSKNNVLSYLRLPGNRRVSLEAIAEIPRVYGAPGEINYERALKNTLIEMLSKKKKRK